ncbi:poly(A) polymerase Cid14 [Schizosaccharomyces japonicus yFS275]|uniref:polynucleotide adenylyltransferase n=1 Tax=Schizosaccharomyces japonicus (strain yFS275 / FY16936) TaxID=402676 RepID=B6JZY7_SCHJY|nr:poly(A) polymerase Cid14 [Schizosaccharomyces japonicus yFS275]EEB06137.1 poly(A) polymerase Cid14 [Schizosaccharomyces japonicus yFS275]
MSKKKSKDSNSKKNRPNSSKGESKGSLARRIFKRGSKSKRKSSESKKHKRTVYDDLSGENNFSVLDNQDPDVIEKSETEPESSNVSSSTETAVSSDVSFAEPRAQTHGKVDPLDVLDKPDLPDEAIKRGEPSILLGVPKVKKRKSIGDASVEGNADFIKFDFSTDDEEEDKEDETSRREEKKSAIPAFMQKMGRFFRDKVSNRKRKRNAMDIEPICAWHKPYPEEPEVARLLHQDILNFINYLEPTPQEHAVRKSLITKLDRAIRAKWPEVTVYVFGSFETRLYLPTSDIDMVVMSSDTVHRGTKKHMYSLARHLKNCKLATEIQVITTANVPIIKFVDPFTRIHVDVSFNQPGGLKTCLVVNGFLKKFPAVRPLTMLVKHFLNMRALNEVFLGGLSSYAIVCLVVSFLQMHPRLSTSSVRQEDNLGVLFLEFLELYGKRYNYDAVGIAVHNGGFYFSKKKMGWVKPSQPYLLSIQDPVDYDNDISKSSRGILRVKATLGNSFDLLTSELYSLAARIEREGLHILKDEKSLLSCIIGIDDNITKHREHIQQCYACDPVPLEPLTSIQNLTSIDVDAVQLPAMELEFVEGESESDDVAEVAAPSKIANRMIHSIENEKNESAYSSQEFFSMNEASFDDGNSPENAVLVDDEEEEESRASSLGKRRRTD